MNNTFFKTNFPRDALYFENIPDKMLVQGLFFVDIYCLSKKFIFKVINFLLEFFEIIYCQFTELKILLIKNLAGVEKLISSVFSSLFLVESKISNITTLSYQIFQCFYSNLIMSSVLISNFSPQFLFVMASYLNFDQIFFSNECYFSDYSNVGAISIENSVFFTISQSTFTCLKNDINAPV